MTMVPWNNDLVLGIEEFDNHHMHLVDLLNTMIELYDGEDGPELEIVLDSLADYATYHFAAEEEWLVRMGYPEVQSHIEEHESFVQRLSQLTREREQRGKQLETTEFLKEWLVNHIRVSDRSYASFVKAAPPEPHGA